MWVDYITLFDEEHFKKHPATGLEGLQGLLDQVWEMGFNHQVLVPFVPSSRPEPFSEENELVRKLAENEIHKFDRWTSYLGAKDGPFFVCLFRSELDAVMAKLLLL